MKDKQSEALKWADAVECAHMPQLAQFLRNQHAEIERLNAAATDSNLILERAQATNLEMLAAIERKDALLRQALETLEFDMGKFSFSAYYAAREGTVGAITKELSQ